MKTKNRNLLLSLLSPIVKEWGSEEVMAAAEEIAARQISKQLNLRLELERSARSHKSARPSAVEQVARVTPPYENVHLLLELAERFDRKQFLPSVPDVREFLGMIGIPAAQMKDRSEAFRKLLPALAELPGGRLEQLTHTQVYSGPSDLSRISDAISSAAANIRRRRDSE